MNKDLLKLLEESNTNIGQIYGYNKSGKTTELRRLACQVANSKYKSSIYILDGKGSGYLELCKAKNNAVTFIANCSTQITTQSAFKCLTDIITTRKNFAMDTKKLIVIVDDVRDMHSIEQLIYLMKGMKNTYLLLASEKKLQAQIDIYLDTYDMKRSISSPAARRFSTLANRDTESMPNTFNYEADYIKFLADKEEMHKHTDGEDILLLGRSVTCRASRAPVNRILDTGRNIVAYFSDSKRKTDNFIQLVKESLISKSVNILNMKNSTRYNFSDEVSISNRVAIYKDIALTSNIAGIIGDYANTSSYHILICNAEESEIQQFNKLQCTKIIDVTADYMKKHEELGCSYVSSDIQIVYEKNTEQAQYFRIYNMQRNRLDNNVEFLY